MVWFGSCCLQLVHDIILYIFIFQTETHRVHIYELTTWKLNDAVPRDLQMIADVIGHVTKSTEKSESDSPITIISK